MKTGSNVCADTSHVGYGDSWGDEARGDQDEQTVDVTLQQSGVDTTA